jgi:hypothetical protein
MGLQRKTLEKIAKINGLIQVYGTLTVRQVYYQLVSTGDKCARAELEAKQEAEKE